MTTPLERKNQLVWDQMDAGQYKQALQLCNRRIKKGEKSENLLALKALVLTLLDTPSHREEAEQIATTLCEKTPPIIAPEVLRLLTRVFMHMGPSKSAEVTQLWERAVKSQPQSEDLAREWFFTCVKMVDWRGAQKAAMNLQKMFTKRREYWFWAIVATLLLHNTLPEDAPQRKLFGTLAYRMMDKARNDTPEDTTVIPPRAIQTSQEVHLLLELLPYVNPDEANKLALKVLGSKNLGVDSAVGSGDWWGLARKRLDLLESFKEWKELYNSCKSLLPKQDPATSNGEEAPSKQEITGRGDDWRVWTGYVLAAGKLYDEGDKTIPKEALNVILEHRKIASSGSSRNGNLALVQFSSLFHDKNDGPEGTPTLLEAVQDYFDTIGSKSCCYEDLQVYLEMLEESEKRDFLKHVKASVACLPEDDDKLKIDKIAAVINRLKFVYLLTISSSSPSEETTKTIIDFVVQALKVYTSSLSPGKSLVSTDNQYGDEAALLSVMGLIRIYGFSKDPAPLYQAIVILETILQKSKHNYQALLMLVRLLLLIGAADLAVGIYPRLNIKQIQNDTLSHYVLTRLSTLAPNDRTTAVLIEESLGIYESSKHQSPKMIQLAFERGGYAQMMGFMEFSERVSGSVCRTMEDVELRRLSRLTSYPTQALIEEVGYKGKVWDNRDFSVVLNCELSTVQSFEKSFRMGPTPGERWVRAFHAAEEIIFYMQSYPSSSISNANGTSNGVSPIVATAAPSYASERIVELIEKDKSSAESEREFTGAEVVYLELVAEIGETISAVAAKEGATVATNLEQFRTEYWPRVLQNIPQETDWRLLHALWMAMDCCATATILTDYLSSVKSLKPGLPKQLVKALQDSVSQTRAAIQEKAKTAAKEVIDEDVVQTLVDGVLAEDGIGKVFREEEQAIGGVEKVAEMVKMARNSVGHCFQGVYT